MAHFAGTFRLESSDKFDIFLSALGVNPLLRTIGGHTKPTLTVQVTKNGTHFQFKQSTSTFRKYDLEFDLCEKFDNRTIDGRMVKSVVELEDGRLVQRDRSTNPDEKDTTFIREINENGDLVMICKVDEVEATRVYKRIP